MKRTTNTKTATLNRLMTEDFGGPEVTDNETTVAPATQRIAIPAPRISPPTEFRLIGVTPYVSNNFSAEALRLMREKQEEGSRSQKGSKKAPKDFGKLFRGSMHVSEDGWIGHPASTFRQAMVDACRLVGFRMTLAKMALFVLADGYDATDGRPLVRIEGEPRQFESFVRLSDGSADIASRARWEKWSIRLRVQFDQDMFTASDIANLLMRVGTQVGIGAGRPFSKTSCGQGWGTFRLAENNEE